MGSSSQGGVEIITKIAAQALSTLAQEAAQLLVGATGAARSRSLGDGDDAPTLVKNTQEYVQNKFADSYGYYYDSMKSQPADGGVVVLANVDTLIWDPAENQNTDIETYLNTVF